MLILSNYSYLLISTIYKLDYSIYFLLYACLPVPFQIYPINKKTNRIEMQRKKKDLQIPCILNNKGVFDCVKGI